MLSICVCVFHTQKKLKNVSFNKNINYEMGMFLHLYIYSMCVQSVHSISTSVVGETESSATWHRACWRHVETLECTRVGHVCLQTHHTAVSILGLENCQ